jgi:putative ABC transport system ATP-binding protein
VLTALFTTVHNDQCGLDRRLFYFSALNKTMVSASNLEFNYSPSTNLVFPSFSIGKGEKCLLLGSSGSGKSTLLYLLGGLLRNYAGSISINDVKLETLSEQALDKFRGQHIGFIFQKNHLITALTVEENLMMSPFLAGLKVDRKRVNEMLGLLGIADKRTSKVTELSQGQAQRVAIARAVINHPSIILADEPTSALDDDHCVDVISLLVSVASVNDATLVIATHDQRLKDKISGRIILKKPNV